MTFFRIAQIVLVVCSLAICGCGSPETANKDADKAASTDDHGHSHDDGHHHVEGHSHGAGPHGGTIADWGGGKFHVEFTVDHDKKEGTVYVFGPDEKTPTPIDAKEITLSIKDPAFSVELKANPLGSEVMGGASRFVGTHENLGIVKEYMGSISGVVDGTPYSGDFEEKP